MQFYYYLEASSAYEGVWMWQFPTLAINWYGEGLSLERIVPLSATTTEIRYQYLFRKSSDEAGSNERKHAIDTSTEVFSLPRLLFTRHSDCISRICPGHS